MIGIKSAQKCFIWSLLGISGAQPELVIACWCTVILCEVKVCFTISFSLYFLVFWKIIITNFIHCLFCLEMMRNYDKKPKNKFEKNKIQHGLQLINNGASIEAELGLSIVEINVHQHSCFKASMSLFSC